MTDKVINPETEETSENSLPWKQIWIALITGAAVGGATYVATKKLTSETSEDEETETPEA